MRRQSDTPSAAVSGPFKANSRSRYVELVLVVDNKSYEAQEKDLKRVFRRCKDIANIVNAVIQIPFRQQKKRAFSSCIDCFAAVRASQHLRGLGRHRCLVGKGRNSNFRQRRRDVDQLSALPTRPVVERASQRQCAIVDVRVAQLFFRPEQNH